MAKKIISNKPMRLTYEPDADVLAWELSREPIVYAEQRGNTIVHFGKKEKPVYIEILEAQKFLRKVNEVCKVRGQVKHAPTRV